MAAEQTTNLPSLNSSAGAADPAGTRRLGLALVVISMAQLMLAVIGSVAWTIVNNHVRHSLASVPAGDARVSARHAALAGSPVYAHAPTTGVTAALTIGAAATVLALVVTLAAIRIRREDLPGTPLPA